MNQVPFEIVIKPALNGYVCQVGCQTVVFEGRAQLLNTLARYLENPGGVQEEFTRNAVNPTLRVPPPPPCCDSMPQACGTVADARNPNYSEPPLVRR